MDARGRFLNHEFPFLQPASAVAHWLLQRNPQRAENKADPFRLPVVRADAHLGGPDDVIVWLGHASFLVRLGGVSLLIDPVLGNLPARGRHLPALPLDPAALTGLDYILVSHAHYDHHDKPSLRWLLARNARAQISGWELGSAYLRGSKGCCQEPEDVARSELKMAVETKIRQ